MTGPLPEPEMGPAVSGPDFQATSGLPDRRLELMFVCAHPAIAANVRTPLMLQTVLGVDAAAIAVAFAMSGSALAQRLVRAKRRIKEAPHPVRRAAGRRARPAPARGTGSRLRGYAIDWQLVPADDPIESLSGEALHLARCWPSCCPPSRRPSDWPRCCRLSEARAPARRAGPGDVSFRSTNRTPPGGIGPCWRAARTCWSAPTYR